VEIDEAISTYVAYVFRAPETHVFFVVVVAAGVKEILEDFLDSIEHSHLTFIHKIHDTYQSVNLFLHQTSSLNRS